MEGAPEGLLLGASVFDVVGVAEHRLEEEAGNDNEADDGVVLVQLLGLGFTSAKISRAVKRRK